MSIDIFIRKEKIISKVKELAARIVKDNIDKDILHLVIVLTGAKTFAADLAREIRKLHPFSIKEHYVKLSSYSGERSTGSIKVKKDIGNIRGYDVIIVEDIVDTGLTLSFLRKHLLDKGARSVKIASFLDKPSRRRFPVKIDYAGFTVPDKFIVGYGLDYNEKYRELRYIGVLVED